MLSLKDFVPKKKREKSSKFHRRSKSQRKFLLAFIEHLRLNQHKNRRLSGMDVVKKLSFSMDSIINSKQTPGLNVNTPMSRKSRMTTPVSSKNRRSEFSDQIGHATSKSAFKDFL